MNIGLLDSGIGGLSVLKEALKHLPNENYIYYADTDNAPYGTKTKDEVKKYIFNAVDFIVQKGIKVLLIACNTATSVAIGDLRKKYDFPIIGMEPAVKPAVEKNMNGSKRVLVLATPLTLREEKFQNLVTKIDSEHIVDMLPTPELVNFAEKFDFDSKDVEEYLKSKLPMDNIHLYGTIVLGCTHFPFFTPVLKKILPASIDIIDGNSGTIKHMIEIMIKNNLLDHTSRSGSIQFFKSGIKVDDERLLQIYRNLLSI